MTVAPHGMQRIAWSAAESGERSHRASPCSNVACVPMRPRVLEWERHSASASASAPAVTTGAAAAAATAAVGAAAATTAAGVGKGHGVCGCSARGGSERQRLLEWELTLSAHQAQTLSRHVRCCGDGFGAAGRQLRVRHRLARCAELTWVVATSWHCRIPAPPSLPTSHPQSRLRCGPISCPRRLFVICETQTVGTSLGCRPGRWPG